MALPHPHGNASGQIGHNADYDTGATPGSTGGKFIGFGEQGTSAIANRAHWALSENIDYLYQIVAGDLAIPEAVSYTVGGGGESTKQITGDIWVGDASYPAAAEGLPLLFSVFDSLYNELQDVGGNKVVVAIVRDSTNVTDVYKNGFETNPVITFKTVDSSGADVTNPYTIPAATDVKLLYAAQGTMEALPTDVFSRFKIISGEEVPAGTLLQDGSRPMTGNLDLDDNNINNVDQINNVSGASLDVVSDNVLGLNATTGMTLVSSGYMTFDDQYLSAPISLSETGETGLTNGLSIVGTLNSNYEMLDTIQGDMLLNTTGSMTFTGASGQIDYPELVYTYNGKRLTVAAGNVTATATTMEYLVLNPSAGTVTKTTSPAGNQIPLTKHYWDGVSSFTTELDIRRALVGRTALMEITVSARHGADFSDLQEALDAAAAAAVWHGMPVVRVIGTVDTTAELVVRAPVRIVGDPGATITITAASGDSLFNCGGHKVIVEDVSLVWNSGSFHQAVAEGAILNPGTNSIIRNVSFSGVSYQFGNGVVWNTGSAYRVLIEHCVAGTFRSAFVLGSSADFSTAYAHECTVRDCNIAILKSAVDARAVVLPGNNNSVRNTYIATTGSGTGYISLVVGNNFVAEDVVEEHGSLGTDSETSLHIPDIDAEVWVRGCSFQADGHITSARNSASGVLRLYVSDTKFYGNLGVYVNPTAIDADASRLYFSGCHFMNGTSYNLQNAAINRMTVVGCRFEPSAVIPCIDSSGDEALISACHFIGSTTAVDISGERSKVLNSAFFECSAYGVAVTGGIGSVVRGNSFVGASSNTASAVRVVSAPHTMVEGNYADHLLGSDTYDLAIFEISTNAAYSKICENRLHDCAKAIATTTNKAPIRVASAHCSVSHNTLEMLDYSPLATQVTRDACIWLLTGADECKVHNNNISYDISGGAGGDINAVYVAGADSVQITDNHFDFYGTVDVPSGTVNVVLIYVYSGDYPVVVGNLSVGSWADAGGPDIGTEELINSQANYGVYNSNRGKHDITTAGTGGIVCGNCIEGATVTVSGGDTAANNV